MARSRKSYVCRECGGLQPRWMGKCPDCGAWDVLEEIVESSGAAAASARHDPQRGLAEGWRVLGAGDGDVDALSAAESAQLEPPRAVRLDTQDASGELPQTRLQTRIGEFDRVLGGGLVPGSVVLLSGEPGIGKSTLLLQAAGQMAAPISQTKGGQSVNGQTVLYVTSEESVQQTRLRAQRLNLPGIDGQLFVLADTNLARVFEQVRQIKPAVLFIDSVQMVYKSDLDASPGTVTQLRRCATELVYLAKSSGIAVILVGHVTKQGQVAGPRLLEHLVDAVLYFEGDRFHAHRIVRAIKNRFGTTLEIGLFEMTGSGLREVVDGRGIAANGVGPARPGSIVCPVMHGARCFMVEVQALTATGVLGAAKRKVSGLDANRMAMLIAVLEQHGGMRLADQDVFASAVGGLRVVEPAADLALCLAIAGAYQRRSLDGDEMPTIALGEIGLGGEVRRVHQLNQRLREAARLGYRRALVPPSSASNSSASSSAGEAESDRVEGIELQTVTTIGAAIDALS